MGKKKKQATPGSTSGMGGIIRIPSNGLATQEEGWVEMSSYMKMKHLPYVEALNLRDLKKAWAKLQVSARGNKVLTLRFDLMATFVTDWNWKDREGNPYPKPAGNPSVFWELKPQEYRWLWDRIWDVIGENYGIPKASDTPS